jgi:hypothetical protein
MELRRWILALGLGVVAIALSFGFLYRTIPPSCITRGLGHGPPEETITETYRNGSVFTTTSYYFVICTPAPVPAFIAYPVEFFGAIIIGIALVVIGALARR